MRQIEDWTGNPEEEQSQEKKVNQKQRIIEAKGKEVSPDYFLFSCLEHERTVKAQKDHGSEVVQWPPFAEGADLPASLEGKSTKELLREMAGWYRTNFKEMSDGRAIDHEMLVEVVGPLVAFSSDIDRLYKAKNGDDIPDYGASFGNNMIWEDVEAIVNEQFGAHSHLFNQFIQWSHAAEPEDRSEPGSRPPVGRHAPRFRSSGPRDTRGPRTGGRDRPPARGGDRPPPRADRPPPRGGDRGPRPERGGPQADGPRRGRGGERGKSNDRGPRGPRGPRTDSAQLEASAMQDVQNAMKTLEKDSGVVDVTLKPTNSFYRRLQHQTAVEAGYESHSVGEGNSRAVCIARKG